jgi:protein involved in polysaccharide export with SLBB domain
VAGGVLIALAAAAAPLRSQQPTPEQLRAALRARPDLAAQIRERVAASGLTPAQIRARLAGAGYPEHLLDPYITPAMEGAAEILPDPRAFTALQALGLTGDVNADLALPAEDVVTGIPGEPRRDLPALSRDSIRIFGLEIFARISNQFQPALAGPVDPAYRLGPGDVLVAVLTGDVELSHTIEVTREGFVVIPQVGQLAVSGLTLAELESVLFERLGRVYSGVRRGPGATTQFRLSVSRLRTNQVYVVGDVARPGGYLISGAGTVLTALYLAGGPTPNGSFRRIEVRRAGRPVDTLDLYDYLLRGDNRHDVRLETGDVVFVPVRGVHTQITGAVVRPAIYELATGETLRDLVAAAGGFEPSASLQRVQIDRILAPAERTDAGRDRVVLDVSGAQLAEGVAPAFPLQPGDRVRVFGIPDRARRFVTVRGNVWFEGRVGFRPGMVLSEAIRLAGGPKPDVVLDRILISRLSPDSSRRQLRSAFRDSTGAVTDDLRLQEDDDVLVFSRTAFRPARYVVVTGAVRTPGRIAYRQDMTLRDAVLLAGGVTEDALLTEAEIARLPRDRSAGALAETVRVPLDSTYLVDRGAEGEYLGPPGVPGPPSGAPDVPLHAYDNVLVLRQPDWELQRVVAIAGQVAYPGRYALRSRAERLTDLIGRAGGLTRDAYAGGAELYRNGQREDGSRLRVVDRLERNGAERADTAAIAPELARRVGIDLPRAIARPDARENLILRAGDSVWVPEYDPTVRVLGAVNAPSSVLHRPGWNLDDYVAAAGGYSRGSDRAKAYVVQPGGRLQSVARRFLFPDGVPAPQPGAVVFVPDRDPSDKKDWAGLLGSIAQILASTVAIIVVATR